MFDFGLAEVTNLKMKPRRALKPRNPIAKILRHPLFHKRVVPSVWVYRRRDRHTKPPDRQSSDAPEL